jgi:transcriptional regulator with XRE-family HTH domain
MEPPAKIIKRLRLSRGFTQAQACGLAGVPRATWSAAESGLTASPHAVTRVRIARALGVTPSSIWRQRPRPLHLEDVQDPRWEPAVRSIARRLERDGSPKERRRFGKRLIAVLDYVDGGSPDPGCQDRWNELWQLGASLMFDPDAPPITIINGRLVERELDGLTPARREGPIAARRTPARAPVLRGRTARR